MARFFCAQNMPKEEQKSEKPKKSEKSNASEISSLLDDYQNDLGAIELTHATFDDKERILMSTPIDQITNKETSSKVTDPTLLSAVLKQNNEEMAQMPSGKVTALTKENRGKSLFMDKILHNHVIPHANSQFDAYTKLWMLSLYRKVYGSFGVLVDFVTGKNGYVGPDFTLLPARAIIPQSGKTSVEDSDRLWVRSRVSRKWLESRDEKVWKGIDKILETKGDALTDLSSQSFVERKSGGVLVHKDEFELLTMYEGDRWRTFHPATKTEVRDMGNPQKNDQIPVIMCHSYPLLDRFFGLGDFERGMTLHAAQGSLINLYMDGVKMGIFPPMKIDPSTIENWDDFKDGIGPGQIWLMKKANFDGVAQMQVNSAGIQSFQSTYQFLKATILTVTGTSDTSVSSKMDPGFGKTPQALKMQAFTQGMQTQFGRRMLENSVEKIFDRMIDLISKKQEKPMKFYLKGKDLEEIAEIAPDVIEMFEVGDMGQVTLKPKDINNVEYRYEIDQGSTSKKDEAMENETLKDLTAFVLKNVPGAGDSLAGDGLVPMGSKVFDLGESMKRLTISSGVTDWDKIIRDKPEAEQGNDLNVEDPNVAQAAGNAFVPPQPPAQIPPQASPAQTMPVAPAPMPPAPTALPIPTSQPPQFRDPAFAAVAQELMSYGG